AGESRARSVCRVSGRGPRLSQEGQSDRCIQGDSSFPRSVREITAGGRCASQGGGPARSGALRYMMLGRLFDSARVEMISVRGWAAMATACAFAAVAPMHAVAGAEATGAAHYQVDAAITQKTGTISSTVTITLPPKDVPDGTAFFIGDWYEITTLTVGGGITTSEGRASKPIAHVRKITLHVPHPLEQPVILRISYHGTLNGPGTDKGEETFTPGRMELRLEDMWLPVRADFAMRFTVDAHFRGIPHDEVVVSQGQYRHIGEALDLQRDYPDFGLPVVAA